MGSFAGGKSASVWSGADVTQHAAQWLDAPGGTHGREGHGFRFVLHCVEAARPQVVRHAGHVAEVPRSHGAEGCAESPHLRQQHNYFRLFSVILGFTWSRREHGPPNVVIATLAFSFRTDETTNFLFLTSLTAELPPASLRFESCTMMAGSCVLQVNYC